MKIQNPHGFQPHRPESKLTATILIQRERKRKYDKERYERMSMRTKMGSPENIAIRKRWGIHKRKAPGWSAMTRIINGYRRHATIKEVPFELTKEQFFQMMQLPCYYCGILPSQVHTHGTWHPFIYNGIDRMDNDKGYTLENVVPCCKVCNRAKRDLPLKDFIEWIQRIIKFQTENRM
jgi:hypothetical protein